MPSTTVREPLIELCSEVVLNHHKGAVNNMEAIRSDSLYKRDSTVTITGGTEADLVHQTNEEEWVEREVRRLSLVHIGVPAMATFTRYLRGKRKKTISPE